MPIASKLPGLLRAGSRGDPRRLAARSLRALHSDHRHRRRRGCDGQVLVCYDAFGFFDAFVPRFVKRYAELGTALSEAARSYIAEVRSGAFPTAAHSIATPGAIGVTAL